MDTYIHIENHLRAARSNSGAVLYQPSDDVTRDIRALTIAVVELSKAVEYLTNVVGQIDRLQSRAR